MKFRALPLLLALALGSCSMGLPLDDDSGMPPNVGGGAAVPVARTALGTSSVTGSNILTVPNITVPSGARLLVFASVTGDLSVTNPAASWNGMAMDVAEQASTQPDAGCNNFSLLTLYVVSGGTGSIVVSGDGAVQAISMLASYWTGLSSAATDPQQNAVAVGSDDNPTVTSPVFDCTIGDAVVAFTMQPVLTSATRTWGNGFTDGQLETETYASECGTDGHKATEGYKIATAAGAQTASKTGGAASDWGIIVAYFKHP